MEKIAPKMHWSFETIFSDEHLELEKMIENYEFQLSKSNYKNN